MQNKTPQEYQASRIDFEHLVLFRIGNFQIATRAQRDMRNLQIIEFDSVSIRQGINYRSKKSPITKGLSLRAQRGNLFTIFQTLSRTRTLITQSNNEPNPASPENASNNLANNLQRPVSN